MRVTSCNNLISLESNVYICQNEHCSVEMTQTAIIFSFSQLLSTSPFLFYSLPQSWIPGTKMPANFPKSAAGVYSSPLAMAIDAPMFKDQKQRLARYFDTEEELKGHLSDPDYVTQVLRDHIWWNLD